MTLPEANPTSTPLPPPARYVPYAQIGDRPNIIVDGAPLTSTVLTLSHWPNNQTHHSVRRDTSTATVFAYLDTPALHQAVAIVSNQHFDEDGLFSMFAIVDPATALAHRSLLTGAALAGDFGIVEHPDAARLCFIIEAFCDPAASPLPADTFAGCEARRVEALYREMLARVPELVTSIDAWKSLWHEPYAHLMHSERLLADGAVTIEEHPDVDLAVVSIPESVPRQTVRRYLQPEAAAVHPFAIHGRTQRNRILRVTGQRYELQYRYESWVQLASRRPLLRVALEDLANELNDVERAAGEWRCEDVNEVAPRLWLEGVDESSLAPADFVEHVRRYLAAAPVAWDPYDWQPDDITANDSGDEPLAAKR